MMPCVWHFKNDNICHHFTQWFSFYRSSPSCHAPTIVAHLQLPSNILHCNILNLCKSSIIVYCCSRTIITYWISFICQEGATTRMQATMCYMFIANYYKYGRTQNFMCKVCWKFYWHSILFFWISQRYEFWCKMHIVYNLGFVFCRVEGNWWHHHQKTSSS